MKHINIFIYEKLTLNNQSKLVQLSDDEKKNTIIQNIIKHKKQKVPQINKNKYFIILGYNNQNYRQEDKLLIFHSDYIFKYFNNTSNIESIIFTLINKLYGDKYSKAILCVYDETTSRNVACGIAEFNFIDDKVFWNLEIIKQYNAYMYNIIQDTSSQS